MDHRVTDNDGTAAVADDGSVGDSTWRGRGRGRGRGRRDTNDESNKGEREGWRRFGRGRAKVNPRVGTWTSDQENTQVDSPGVGMGRSRLENKDMNSPRNRQPYTTVDTPLIRAAGAYVDADTQFHARFVDDDSTATSLVPHTAGNMADSPREDVLHTGADMNIFRRPLRSITLVKEMQVSNVLQMPADKTKFVIPEIVREKMANAKQTFVQTKGYNYVSSTLSSEGVVTICGSPGSGKTVMSLMLMEKYRLKDYDIRFIESLSDFDFKDISLKRYTLLIFDDLFGHFSPTTAEFVLCRKLFDDLESHFKYLRNRENSPKRAGKDEHLENKQHERLLKIVFNSRTNIFNEVEPKIRKYQSSLFRPSTVARLMSLTKLDTEEKERILRKHLELSSLFLEDKDIRAISMLEYNLLGFPHICELYVKNRWTKISAIWFFQQPLEYLVQVLREIFISEETSTTAAVFLLMMLNDGSLNLIDLVDSQASGHAILQEMLKTVCTTLPHLTYSDSLPVKVNIAARSQIGMLLSGGDITKFDHPTISDAVAYVVGYDNPVFVVTHCSIQFILERVKVDMHGSSSKPSGGTNYDFNILLGGCGVRVLIARLVHELVSVNLAPPLSHPSLLLDNIANQLFQQLDKDLEDVLHGKDTDHGLGFLFWTTFSGVNSVCKRALKSTKFSTQELLEGYVGCCMSGTIDSFKFLMQYPDPCLDEIKGICVGDIADYQAERTQYDWSLSNTFSQLELKKTHEKETPRMHGNSRDKCIHIAAANGHTEIVMELIKLGTEVDIRGGNSMTALMYATYRGHIKLVQVLLEKGADPSLQDQEGDNCLHLAARGGFKDIIDIFCSLKMDLNSHGEHERTPLMYASYHGQADAVTFLLESGATPEPDLSTFANQDNSLHLACVKNEIDIVKILLKNGRMNIEAGGVRGRTAIIYACRNGSLESAKELVRQGAKRDVADDNKLTCLHVAAMKGQTRVVEWLLSMGLEVDPLSDYNRTPLMLALINGFRDTADVLLNHGAKISLKDKGDSTCIYFAASAGNIPLIEKCLATGQDINCLTRNKWTPLIAACKRNVETVKFLFEKGANINCSDNMGRTCIHASCLSGHLDILEYLLQHNTDLDINRKATNGATPLRNACLKGHLHIVEYLLKLDVDTNDRNDLNQTYLHIACKGGNENVVERLLALACFGVNDEDDSGRTPLFYATQADSPKVIYLLVSYGADINALDNTGSSCLHDAALSGNINAASMLLDLGLSLDSKDKLGKTPLMVAASNHKYLTHIVNLLTERGADVNEKTADGSSCLHVVAQLGGHCSMAGFLLQSGVDINLRDDLGQTPVMIACKNGHNALFDWMLSKGADLNLRSGDMSTCLHFACMSKDDNLKIVGKLLSRGFDAHAQNSHGQSPIAYAQSNGNQSILEMLQPTC